MQSHETETGKLTQEGLIEPVKVLLFRVKDSTGSIVTPWPTNYKLPSCLSLCIGVPQKEGNLPLRIAFCNAGSSVTHASLEPFARDTASGRDYYCINALSSKTGKPDSKRSLQILTMDPKDVGKLVGLGIDHRYDDPWKILTERHLQRIATVLKIDEWQFVVDNRWKTIIGNFQAELAQSRPISGVPHLKWEAEHRNGG